MIMIKQNYSLLCQKARKNSRIIMDNILTYLQQRIIVELNVGGTHFETTLSTLLKGETVLSAMISGKLPVREDRDGKVFIDRDPKHFNRILNFLRDGDVPLPATQTELEELKREAEFYCIDSLIRICESESCPSKKKEKMKMLKEEQTSKIE